MATSPSGEPAAAPRWQVRPARPADASACAALAVAAWQRVHAAYRDLLGSALHDQLFPDWQEEKAGAVARLVGEHPERALVATAGDAIVGFVTFRLDPVRLVGEIGNNAVDPAWQGQGIATALYRAAISAFRAAGLRVARVSTGLDDGHAPARAAYEKVGFQLGLPSITYYQEL